MRIRRGGGVGSRCSTVGPGSAGGSVDEQRADAQRSEVVDRELQEVLDHLGVAVLVVGDDCVHQAPRRRLVVPAEVAPAQHAEAPDDAHPDRRVALHDRGVEQLGEHHQVSLRAGRPVEHHPLVGSVAPSEQEARETVGEEAGDRQRASVHRSARDRQLRAALPTARVGARIEDGSAAHHPALVDLWAERVIDLLEEQRPERFGPLDGQPGLVELLGQPPQPRRSGHRSDAIGRRRIGPCRTRGAGLGRSGRS